jgi:hypothetical protein
MAASYPIPKVDPKVEKGARAPAARALFIKNERRELEVVIGLRGLGLIFLPRACFQ